MFKTIFKTVFTVALIMSAKPALALECSEPKAFVESVKTDVLGVINSQSPADGKRAELDKIFRSVTDLDWMGKFVLGRGYSTLTPEQQKEYAGIYANYLSASYVERFKSYNGQKITVNTVKPVNSDFAVDTTIEQEGKAPIAVTYRLRKEGSCYKVSDIVAEGVSLINTQRQDFGSVFNREGYTGLAQTLKTKTDQYASGTAK